MTDGLRRGQHAVVDPGSDRPEGGPLVRLHLASSGQRLDATVDGCEGRQVAVVGELLPPVVARMLPERRRVSRRQPRPVDGRDRPAVPTGVLDERPHPGAVSIELEVGPGLGPIPAIERETCRQELVRVDRLASRSPGDEALDPFTAGDHHPVTPGEEGLSRCHLSGTTHGVGDERPIAQPRVAVDGERRGGDVCALRGPGWWR